MKLDKGVVGPASSHVLETEVAGDISLYDPTKEQVSVLNGTASDIWRLADGTRTVEEITTLIAASYQVDSNSIADDVARIVERLADADLLRSP